MFAESVASNPDMTFILTARPPAVKEPMLAWLGEHDVNIPPENVICLGSSAAGKKRDWIKNKALETKATKAMFWDDRDSNTKAVDSLNNIEKYPEMEGIEVVATLVAKKR